MAGKRKKVTLKEFRAWLEGVEELQPKEWAPDKAQWKLIREKINHIIEEKITQQINPSPIHIPPVQQHTPKFIPPPIVDGIPSGDIEMSPNAKQLMGTGGKTKTPDIDTTNGPYTSDFT